MKKFTFNDEVTDEVTDKVTDEVTDKVTDEVIDEVTDKVTDEVTELVLESNEETKQETKQETKKQLLKNLQQSLNSIGKDTISTPTTLPIIENTVAIKKDDLTLILNLLIIINKRGGFLLEEFGVVGDLYSNLMKLRN
jgi:CO dehydrogenase/acetyl-CoA synthase alpha subunit